MKLKYFLILLGCLLAPPFAFSRNSPRPVCDTLFLRDGRVLPVHAWVMDKVYIQFSNCGGDDSTLYKIQRKDVLEIRPAYSNAWLYNGRKYHKTNNRGRVHLYNPRDTETVIGDFLRIKRKRTNVNVLHTDGKYYFQEINKPDHVQQVLINDAKRLDRTLKNKRRPIKQFIAIVTFIAVGTAALFGALVLIFLGLGEGGD